MIRLAITMGDPSGIGPEVIVKALDIVSPKNTACLIVGDRAVMTEAVNRYASREFRARWRRCPRLEPLAAAAALPAAPLVLIESSKLVFADLIPGRPGKKEGQAMRNYLETAWRLLRSGAASALVTAPVTKSALAAVGFPGPGHTDWLAQKTGATAVMMLTAGRLRVVPLTVHIPLAAVPAAISRELILSALCITDAELKKKIGIRSPRLAVAGLNPHAGEEGQLGREELEVIAPAVAAAKARGLRASGPFPADTLFLPEKRKTYDAALCMYHDQALIPLKTVGLARGVNVTLGLPLIRTSPAHGAAPDIAWQGKADPRSMAAAIALAARLAK